MKILMMRRATKKKKLQQLILVGPIKKTYTCIFLN